MEEAGTGPVEESEKLCEWEGPRAPEVRLLFDDVRAAPAVLTVLRDTQVGRIVSQALRRREGEDGRKVDREGRGRAGPALRVFIFSCLSLRTWHVPSG